MGDTRCTHFFLREYLTFFRAAIFLNFSGFEPKIILKLFSNVKGVPWAGNERNIFRSLLMSQLTIKQSKRGPEMPNFNLKGPLKLQYAKILSLDEA